MLVVGGCDGDSAARRSRGQGNLGKKSRLVAVIWAVEARSMLADLIDLRRTVEGELGARTHGDCGKPAWGRLPQSSEGKEGERRRGDGAFCAEAEGLSLGLFIGQRARFARKYLR